jgi:hypothetical protein
MIASYLRFSCGTISRKLKDELSGPGLLPSLVPIAALLYVLGPFSRRVGRVSQSSPSPFRVVPADSILALLRAG